MNVDASVCIMFLNHTIGLSCDEITLAGKSAHGTLRRSLQPPPSDALNRLLESLDLVSITTSETCLQQFLKCLTTPIQKDTLCRTCGDRGALLYISTVEIREKDLRNIGKLTCRNGNAEQLGGVLHVLFQLCKKGAVCIDKRLQAVEFQRLAANKAFEHMRTVEDKLDCNVIGRASLHWSIFLAERRTTRCSVCRKNIISVLLRE